MSSSLIFCLVEFPIHRLKLVKCGIYWAAETRGHTIGAEIPHIGLGMPASHLPGQMQALGEAVYPSIFVLPLLVTGHACATSGRGTRNSCSPGCVFPSGSSSLVNIHFLAFRILLATSVRNWYCAVPVQILAMGWVSPPCHSLPSTCGLLCGAAGTGSARHLSAPNLTAVSCSTTLLLAFNSPPVLIGLKILVVCPSRALGQVLK